MLCACTLDSLVYIFVKQNLDSLFILKQAKDLVDGLSHHLLLLPHSWIKINKYEWRVVKNTTWSRSHFWIWYFTWQSKYGIADSQSSMSYKEKVSKKQAHDDGIWALNWTAGKTNSIITGSVDETLKFWNPETLDVSEPTKFSGAFYLLGHQGNFS